MINKRFPNYPDDADYTTNANSYYDDLARKHKLIELLSKKIWEYDEELAKRFDEWDGLIESFPDNVESLLQEWLLDGTLDHIINETLLSSKADQSELDKTNALLLLAASKEEVNSMIGNLADATPEFADDVDGMDDTTKLYVNLSDGYVYSFDGSDWVNIGVKYQSEGISDNTIDLDQLNKSDLITDYVKRQGSLNLSTIEKGKYEINLNSKGDLFITNGNMFDVLKATGTHSHGGLTITATGNTVKVTGTSSANLYARISDGVLITGSNAELNQKEYKLPEINNFAIGLYNKTINAPEGLTFNVRSKYDGNIGSLPVNSVQPYGNFKNPENWGALYLFLPAGIYDVTLDIFIMPNDYVEKNRIKPSTKIIENVQKTRLELKDNERLITSLSGSAFQLINIYENLQTVQANPQNKQIYVESHTDYFYYYIKGSNKNSNNYLRYTFEYWNGELTNNGKGWVLGEVHAVEIIDGNVNVLYPVVKTGEWEMAIRLDGRPDFIGCKQHGSEVSFYNKFYIDGTEWIPNNSSFWCDEIKVVEKLNMYDPNDEITEVGKHRKFYVIDKDSIHIKQRIEWNQNLIMGNNDVFVAMLPLVRGNDTTTPYQVSDKAYDDNTYEEIDVSVPTHDGRTPRHEPDQWTLYSDSTGISASVKSISKEKLTGANSFIQNSASYNKVYFNYCEPQHNVVIGDVWENEITYKLNINS